jgi:hypothetical protein
LVPDQVISFLKVGVMPLQPVSSQSSGCCVRFFSRTLATGLLAAVPAVALVCLGVTFSLGMLADAQGAAPMDSLMPAPTTQVRSAPVAPVQGADQGATVLDNWTYTRRPVSPST